MNISFLLTINQWEFGVAIFFCVSSHKPLSISFKPYFESLASPIIHFRLFV